MYSRLEQDNRRLHVLVDQLKSTPSLSAQSAASLTAANAAARNANLALRQRIAELEKQLQDVSSMPKPRQVASAEEVAQVSGTRTGAKLKRALEEYAEAQSHSELAHAVVARMLVDYASDKAGFQARLKALVGKRKSMRRNGVKASGQKNL